VVSGVAEFTDLEVDAEGVGYTLMASAYGITAAESDPFQVERNLAAIQVTPAAATLESLGETVQLTAEAESPGGRVIPDVTFDWSAAPQGVCTVDAAGLVTAADNGTCTVTAAANGASGSADVTVHQTRAQLGFIVQPVGGLAEETLATQPIVEVRDANANLVESDNATRVALTIGTNPSGGALSGVTELEVVSGAATFTDLVVDMGGIGYTLAASATGLTGAESDPFDTERNIGVIAVTPTTATLESLGETVQLTAEARSPAGRVIPDVTFDWDVSHQGICVVDADGLVTAVDNGTCTVTAAANGASGSATVTVSQRSVRVTVSPNLAVLAEAETRSMSVEAVDGRGNPIASPTHDATCRSPGVAVVSGVDVTGQAAGVTDCVWASDGATDSARVAVVEGAGFAAILSTSGDTYRIVTASAATLELDLWLIRPSDGDGELGSIQGTLEWDPTMLTYQSSAATESGWTWVPNENDVGTGVVRYGAFSAPGTANTFVLARVTFTVSGGAGGTTPLRLEITVAGNAIGVDILALMQPTWSQVLIQ
jgi:hypothetical protein